MEMPDRNEWALVARTRIFFGHQSVGQNIVDGILELKQELNDTSLFVDELTGERQFPEFYFVHKKIGQNKDPESKCRAFREIIEQQLSKNNLQIAFFKFCYVDITKDDDPQQIFDEYRKTIEYLKERFPQIRFVHVTVPLVAKARGKKAWLKRKLGILDKRELGNIKRFQFNQLLKKHFANDPIFDLAGLESTHADGSRATFKKDGKTYYYLADEYTTDGGHLNRTGRKRVASALIKFLADVISRSTGS